MIRRLMAFSRSEALEMQRVDLAHRVRDAAATLGRLLGGAVTIRLEVPDAGLWVYADSTVLDQCLMNLATNARDAMPSGGVLTLRLARRWLDAATAAAYNVRPGEYAVVQVEDTGIGMDEPTRQRAFEPLFTTKPRGKGTGLGLSMVHGLIRQHRGFARLESALGRGTMVELALPLMPEEGNPGRPAGAAPPATDRLRGTETILVVDDEEALRGAMRRALERYGYSVLTATDGLEGLEVLRREGERIRLIISDVSMPRLTGPDLFRALRAEGLTMPFLFSSGYDRPEVGALAAGVRAMAKPWTIEELLIAVRAALDS
jgi:CheY-like chemotaxis protein